MPRNPATVRARNKRHAKIARELLERHHMRRLDAVIPMHIYEKIASEMRRADMPQRAIVGAAICVGLQYLTPSAIVRYAMQYPMCAKLPLSVSIARGDYLPGGKWHRKKPKGDGHEMARESTA